jgi:hypothetical protein
VRVFFCFGGGLCKLVEDGRVSEVSPIFYHAFMLSLKAIL